jgi:hypothetical protein
METFKYKDLRYSVRKYSNSKYYGTCYRIGCFSFKTKKELEQAFNNGELDFYRNNKEMEKGISTYCKKCTQVICECEKINNMLKTNIQKQITLDFIKWKEKTKLEYINGTIRGKDENGNDVRDFFSKILKDDDALFDYWWKLPKPII